MELDERMLGLKNPLSGAFPFYVLIETHGSNDGHDQEKISMLLEDLMEQGMVQDGTMAQDTTQVSSGASPRGVMHAPPIGVYLVFLWVGWL